MARVVLFSTDLSRNAVYIPWQFLGVLGRKHQVNLVGPSSGGLWKPLATELSGAVVLPGSGFGSKGALAAAVEASEGAEFLYAFKALPESLGLALKVRRELDVPLALHLCDWDAGYFAHRSWARRVWYGLRGLGNPRGPLALQRSEAQIDQVDLLTVSTSSLQRRFGGTRIPPGLDTKTLKPEHFPREEARTRLGVGEDETVVLFLGTPTVHKGLADLREVVEAVTRPQVRFIIVGVHSGADEALGGLNGPSVTLIPPVPFSEAPWFLAASDVFLVPQRSTPFADHQLPAKMVLAMAMARPVLTTNVGDAKEILNGDPPSGRVVQHSDPAAMGRALDELLADPELRERMGREARRRAVADLSWDAMDGRLSPLLAPFLGP